MRTNIRILAVTTIAALALASAALAFPSNPLVLTPAQKQQIQALKRKEDAEIAAVNFGLGKRADKDARIDTIKQKYDAAGLAVLTPVQRAKLASDQQRVRAVQLTLTPAQKSKAERIKREYGLKARTILGNSKISDTERRAQYSAMQNQLRIALESILTNKQRAALPK